jgi:hypothetical protein
MIINIKEMTNMEKADVRAGCDMRQVTFILNLTGELRSPKISIKRIQHAPKYGKYCQEAKKTVNCPLTGKD